MYTIRTPDTKTATLLPSGFGSSRALAACCPATFSVRREHVLISAYSLGVPARNWKSSGARPLRMRRRVRQGGETTEPSTRTVEHTLGASKIPASSERVVALDYFALVAALAVGTRSVRTTLNGDPEDQARYLRARLEGIEIIGAVGEPHPGGYLGTTFSMKVSSR